MKPFPNLVEVYNLALREESQRRTNVSPLPEISTMAISYGNQKKKSSVTYSHCGKNGHSKDKCYRIIGFPPNFKFIKGKSATGDTPSANSVTQGISTLSNVSETSPALSLTPEQGRRLLTLLNGCDS
uniref:Uncharacterized protein n=1 Tax=Nelumbo nucifera TaxID=4432 RepID=A0A822XYK1_NELNU|nr:TPA_asm: hypothetical protein HUJ06_026247 [Nelumbo nucifera]